MGNFNINNPPINIPDAIQWCIDGIQLQQRRIAALSNSNGGALSIGDHITGSAANQVLFMDGANSLTQSDSISVFSNVLRITNNNLELFTSALAATTSSMLRVQNTTAATGSVKRQFSPSIELWGTNWKSSDSSSNIIGIRQYVSGTSVNTPSPQWNIDYTVDGGGGYTNLITVNTVSSTFTGNLIAIGDLTVSGGTITTGSSGITISTGKTIVLTTSTAASATAGTATLVSGTKTINTTAVAASDLIFLSVNTPGGTTGINYTAPSGSIVPGVSFVINSSSAAGAVVVTDTSIINWWIVRTT